MNVRDKVATQEREAGDLRWQGCLLVVIEHARVPQLLLILSFPSLFDKV